MSVSKQEPQANSKGVKQLLDTFSHSLPKPSECEAGPGIGWAERLEGIVLSPCVTERMPTCPRAPAVSAGCVPVPPRARTTGAPGCEAGAQVLCCPSPAVKTGFAFSI